MLLECQVDDTLNLKGEELPLHVHKYSETFPLPPSPPQKKKSDATWFFVAVSR